MNNLLGNTEGHKFDSCCISFLLPVLKWCVDLNVDIHPTNL